MGNPNNSKSAATSAIFARRRKGRKRKRRWLRECNVVFAKRKGRRKERSPDKHLDSQHYKATLLVWEEILSSTFSPWLLEGCNKPLQISLNLLYSQICWTVLFKVT